MGKLYTIRANNSIQMLDQFDLFLKDLIEKVERSEPDGNISQDSDCNTDSVLCASVVDLFKKRNLKVCR